MSAANIAATLPFAVLAACLYRARLLALALVPPCALIIARSLELVDISSASHPLRWLVPVSCAGLAGMALVVELRKPVASRAVLWAARAPVSEYGFRWQWYRQRFRDKRTIVACLLVLGSCAPDLLALHPFFWARFAEWPLVPVQIAVCISILVVLLVPERWVAKCLR